MLNIRWDHHWSNVTTYALELGKDMKLVRLVGAMAILVVIATTSTPAGSFDLSPQGTQYDRDAVKNMSDSQWDRWFSAFVEVGLPKFKSAVHEEITHRSFGCAYDGAAMCGNPDANFATASVLAGVRWNDDPPFQLNVSQIKAFPKCTVKYKDGRIATIRFISQPGCWASLFLNAKKQLERKADTRFDASTQAALPLRSHFGDLQFLHSMASANGEPAALTQARILGWSKFMWSVVTGDNRAETWLKDVDLPVVRDAFSSSGWRLQDLFALGDPTLRDKMGDVAFGSLLHVIQDSFSRAHVDRMDPAFEDKCPGTQQYAPGPIREFHSYTGQDSEAHALADTRAAYVNFGSMPGPVEVGQALKRYKAAGAKWPEVEPYLICVFQLSPVTKDATAGGF